jgi:hypothetical protein
MYIHSLQFPAYLTVSLPRTRPNSSPCTQVVFVTSAQGGVGPLAEVLPHRPARAVTTPMFPTPILSTPPSTHVAINGPENCSTPDYSSSVPAYGGCQPLLALLWRYQQVTTLLHPSFPFPFPVSVYQTAEKRLSLR